ncbi:MAG: LacI family DNA-binding transcriptional regulator, partial [Actinobacteria bacterium]|nr:LacI family DNA-binding transcriptional regulator [Actinomycetota bacterium]
MSSPKETKPPTTAPARARLADVAREAGVSKALASRVLNGEKLPIRQETSERVVA